LVSARQTETTEKARAQVLAEAVRDRSDLVIAIEQEAINQRTRLTNDARENILKNEAALKAGLIDFELDVAEARSANNVKRMEDERKTAIAIKLLEEQIARLRSGDAGEHKTAVANERQQILQAEVKVLQDLMALRDPALNHCEPRSRWKMSRPILKVE
jgi:hypothetical protein